MAQAAITGLSQLPDEDRRMLYSDLVERALCTRLRKALEMLPETQKFFSVGHRRSYAKGITQGMATATAKALLTILAQRGLPMTARQRRTISECTKLATLDRWLERAVSVASVDDLLG